MVVSRVLQARRAVRRSRPTELTSDNLRIAFTRSEFVQVVLSSVGVALAVTLLCLVLALPMAFYIAKVAKPWARRGLIVAVLLPLWAGYLVKGYAWKAMLRPAGEFGDTNGGFLQSVFGWTPGFGMAAVVMTLTYLWLPYMVLPIYAGLDRLPPSLLDAAGDLGARPLRTFAQRDRPAARAGDRRRQHLHVLAVARRLHHAELVSEGKVTH